MNSLKSWLFGCLAGTVVILTVFPSGPATAGDIHYDAWTGKIENIRQYLADGEDADARDKNGSTPLHFASHKGYMDIIRLLITYDADVNARDMKGRTPLCIASQEGQKEVVELLLDSGAGINLGSKKGLSPLHFAGNEKQLSVVELLVAEGADINARDRAIGGTPLLWAVALDGGEVAACLIENGADVNVGDTKGRAPLHYAVLKGEKALVKLLIDGGAHVNARTKGSFQKQGDTPLKLAAEAGHGDIVDLLKRHGAQE